MVSRLRYVKNKENEIRLYWIGKNPKTKSAYEEWLKGKETFKDISDRFGLTEQTLILHSMRLKQLGLVEIKEIMK